MKLRLALVLGVLVIALAGAGVVLAQGAYNTGIDIQNLTANPGNLVVQFYDSTGAPQGSLSSAIGAWGGVNFYLPTQSAPPAGGKYSAVVSADVQVAAVASQADYTLGGADMYLGTSNPGNSMSFPLVYRNHTTGLWNSILEVQNASATAQTVYLSLYTAGASTAAATASASVPAYASHSFDISQAGFAAFGPFGSAVVTATAPLAGASMNLRNPNTGALNVIHSEYRAFGPTQQGRDIILPLVYKNFNLWTSGVNILNKSSMATTVYITYTNSNPAVVGGPWYDHITLGPNAADTFYTPANATGLPNAYFGSAKVSSSAADIAVVVASQRYRTDGAQGVAYEGSLPSEATACVSLPIVHNRTTWKTGINILNLGGSQANVTINYYSTAPGISNATQSFTIPGNSPKTIYMPLDSPTALGFFGAAEVKSTNAQPLLVNVANSRTGVSSNYVGVNYTCP